MPVLMWFFRHVNGSSQYLVNFLPCDQINVRRVWKRGRAAWPWPSHDQWGLKFRSGRPSRPDKDRVIACWLWTCPGIITEIRLHEGNIVHCAGQPCEYLQALSRWSGLAATLSQNNNIVISPTLTPDPSVCTGAPTLWIMADSVSFSWAKTQCAYPSQRGDLKLEQTGLPCPHNC